MSRRRSTITMKQIKKCQIPNDVVREMAIKRFMASLRPNENK